MKQFKAMMIKEWNTHRKTLLVPVWFTLTIYAVILIGLLINLIRGGSFIVSGDIRGVSVTEMEMINWAVSYGMAIVLGYISIFSGWALADSLLNEDYRKRCEILHLSQPVSLLKILGTKLTLLLGMAMVILFVLVIFNTSVLSILGANMFHVSIITTFTGAIQGFISIMITYFFAVALIWLASSVFKNKSGLYLMLLAFVIELSIQILNRVYGFAIPSLWVYVSRLLFVSFNVQSQPGQLELMMVEDLIAKAWSAIFDTDSMMKLIYGIVFFCSSYFLYRRREIT